MKMRNISETVLLCIIIIAAIQSIVLYLLMRKRKCDKEEIFTHNHKIVELLKPTNQNGEQLNSNCCN